jgi:hypothetical protein
VLFNLINDDTEGVEDALIGHGGATRLDHDAETETELTAIV